MTSRKDEDDRSRDHPPAVSKGKLDTKRNSLAPQDHSSLSRQSSSGLEFMRPFGKETQRDGSGLDLIVMITKETQTDWEWADFQAKQTAIEVKELPKMADIGKFCTDFFNWVLKRIEDPNKPGTPPPFVTPIENYRNEGIQVEQAKTTSIGIQAFQTENKPDDVVPEPYLELKMSRQETRVVETPIVRKHGGATPVQEPWPPRSPLYGRPVMMFEDDDFHEADVPKQKEYDDQTEKDTESMIDAMSVLDGKLPHLGLPGSLMIKKDSAMGKVRTREEFEQMISEPALRVAGEGLEDGVPHDASFTNLVCEFCENPLRPFPTLDQQRTMATSELYCCDDYRKFVEFVLATDDAFEQQFRNKVAGSRPDTQATDSKPEKSSDHIKIKIAKQPSLRTQQNAQEERLRRLELERHMAMLEKAKKMRESQLKDGKQVKTINFQLSKYRCYEQGMVILPPDFHLSEMEQFQHRKIQAALAEQAALQHKRQIVDIEGLAPAVEYNGSGDYTTAHRHHGEASYLLDGGVPVIKKYENKVSTFLILLADGTSTVFYPSGNIAINVSLFNGIRTFTAFDDKPTSQTRILAMFMSSGFGTVYSSDGTVRLSLTPAAGFEVNPADGTKRRRWTWAEMAAGNGNHVHAPPFQCIFYHLNSYLSVRIGDYQDWTITFFYKHYRCRFNVISFAAFDVVDANAFDMSDIRLVRLNKYRSQFNESHTKLKALLREINYMLGLLPSNSLAPSGGGSGGISFSLASVTKSLDAIKDPTPRTTSQPLTSRKGQRPSKTILPPILGTPAVEVD